MEKGKSMKVLRKILLASDLTPAAADAAREAAVVAKAFQSEIVLLNVLPAIPESSIDLDNVKQETAARLEQLRQELQAEGLTVAEPLVVAGQAADEIVRPARSSPSRRNTRSASSWKRRSPTCRRTSSRDTPCWPRGLPKKPWSSSSCASPAT